MVRVRVTITVRVRVRVNTTTWQQQHDHMTTTTQQQHHKHTNRHLHNSNTARDSYTFTWTTTTRQLHKTRSTQQHMHSTSTGTPTSSWHEQEYNTTYHDQNKRTRHKTHIFIMHVDENTSRDGFRRRTCSFCVSMMSWLIWHTFLTSNHGFYVSMYHHDNVIHVFLEFWCRH